MAVLTELVCDRTMEIAFFMAFRATLFGMLPGQTEFRQVVIEVPGGTITLPPAGIVTAFALTARLHILKGAAVGILVAALAAVEGYPFEYQQLLRRIDIGLAGHGLRLRRRSCSWT